MREHAINQNEINREYIGTLQKQVNAQIERFKDPWLRDEVLDAEQQCFAKIKHLQQMIAEITRNDVIIATIEAITTADYDD